MAGARRPDAATVLVALLAAAFAACTAAGPGGSGLTQAVSNVATAVAATAAGVACLVRGVRVRGRAGAAWAGVGLGSLAYASGEWVWTWIQTVRAEPVPFPGLPDAGYLAMVPLMAGGLLLIPGGRRSAAYRARGVVDGLLIGCSLLLISWMLVLRPAAENAGRGTGGFGVLLAYPLGDVVLVTVVLSLRAGLTRGSPHVRTLRLIGAAAVLIGLTDSVYAYVSLRGTYASGGVLDTGWFLGFGLILLAAVRPDGTRRRGRTPAGRIGERPLTLLPYAAVLAALAGSVADFAVSGQVDPFIGGCRSALIVLAVVRQLLTLRENRHLSRRLESRVGARTAELRASEQRFRALVRHSSDSVAVIEPDSTIRYQSDSVERVFGWPAHALLGHRLVHIAGAEAGPCIAAAIEQSGAEPRTATVIEVPVRHRDGRVRLAEMTVTNLRDDPAVRGFVLNTRDVHDARELQDRIVHEAYHDRLTGLPARALFRERAAEALDRGRGADHAAVLLLDLDGFKGVNDSLGHAAGDLLLRQVAERLRAAVREEDLVARLGGDEFSVLVTSPTARADAETVARRIAVALTPPFVLGEHERTVAASIGLAAAVDADDADQLLRNADLAMYRAKSAGGDRVTRYDPAMLSGLVERLHLEADLRRALDRDELTLHYQPTVDLRTGVITGFEALVRWQHPERGTVPPLDFIGIAEATGLIAPLGRWVLAEACRQAVAWGAGRTRALKMAVNVSVRQFDTDLAATVAQVLAETGLPAGSLCLEMTESVLLTDTDENLTHLHRLKALGVSLAMDDFGTGYSSLAYLRRYPLDILKIDRSFVDRLGGEREDEALAAAIVRLGRDLGMATVAEGIEDDVQLATLQDLGCDFAQGYRLSRPLPPADAGRVLADGLPAPLRAALTAGR
ncbi:putative bifunctional diguanylate cyclase/phosphodiesterase [Nucisporomicrobium flavum]|uniref:putative bifunctional diguanylate cyclase/phosphodiesterase n=1 Tax=Nucisporomicrobium flavum TaxID=2785915 RepID=UPI003C2E2B8B